MGRRYEALSVIKKQNKKPNVSVHSVVVYCSTDNYARSTYSGCGLPDQEWSSTFGRALSSFGSKKNMLPYINTHTHMF